MIFFHHTPLLGILRGITADMIVPLADIAASSGLEALEITMNTADAPRLVGMMQKASAGRFRVGAGTVLTAAQLDDAMSAGAEFIVSPVTDRRMIRLCADADIPVFPGAFSPTEVWEAWDSGATMVKLFPASMLGAKYIKELKAPLDQVKILVCGGISAENIGEYLRHGASAAAFGASIFDVALLNAGEYHTVQKRLGALIDACNISAVK